MIQAHKDFLKVLIVFCCLPLLGLLAFLPRAIMGQMKIEVNGGDECHLVPASARNIYARGNYLGFAAEFDISEADFIKACEGRKIAIKELTTPRSTMRYLANELPDHPASSVTIYHGLVYDSMSHRGGVTMVFDREQGKAYMRYAHH